MQEVITNPTVRSLQLRRPATAAAAVPVVVPSASPRRVSLLEVWRDAVATFGTQCGPILACALVSVAVTRLLDGALPASITGSALWALAQLTLVMLTQSFVRAAIGWIALYGSEGDAQGYSVWLAWCAVWRAALSRWAALVSASVLYTLLIALCAIGLSAWLREGEPAIPPDLNSLSFHVNQLVQEVASQGMRTPLFAPDVPYASVLKIAKGVVARQPEPTLDGYWNWVLKRQYYDPMLSDADRALITQEPAQHFVHILEGNDPLIALGSVIVLVVMETLLRFRTITALTSKGRGLIAPIRDSARLGVSHFGMLAGHVWVLRLFIGITSLFFVEAPMQVAQALAVPWLAQASGGVWINQIGHALFPVGHAVAVAAVAAMGALFAAFSAVYDARLYAAVQRQTILGSQ